jgi:hypothetical protein
MIARGAPRRRLLGEEGSRRRRRFGLLWVVDPLMGPPTISTGCDLVGQRGLRGRPGGLVGVVFDPAATSCSPSGAGRAERPPVRCQGDDLSRALIGTGFAYEPETRAPGARARRALSQVRDIAAADRGDRSGLGRLRPADGYYGAGNLALGSRPGMLLVRGGAGGDARPGAGEGALAAGSARTLAGSAGRRGVSPVRSATLSLAFRSRLAGPV